MTDLSRPILNPKYSIVIIAWKRPLLTQQCIDSALKQDFDNFNIIIVDNGSDFKRDPYKDNDKIIIIGEGENIGCSAGFNLGLSYASKIGSDYVLMVNNDVKIMPNTLRVFDEFIKDKKDLGIVGLSLEEDGCYSYGGELDFNTAQYKRAIFNRKILPEDIPSSDVLAPSASVMLIPCSIYKKTTGFDQSFFAYWEDVDFFWRILKLGYKNYVIINEHAVHNIQDFVGVKENVRVKTSSAYYFYYMTRNHYFFLKKAWNGKVPLRYIYWWLAESFNVYHFEKENGNKQEAGVVFDAIYCALKDKRGEWGPEDKDKQAPFLARIGLKFIAYCFG